MAVICDMAHIVPPGKESLAVPESLPAPVAQAQARSFPEFGKTACPANVAQFRIPDTKPSLDTGEERRRGFSRSSPQCIKVGEPFISVSRMFASDLNVPRNRLTRRIEIPGTFA